MARLAPLRGSARLMDSERLPLWKKPGWLALLGVLVVAWNLVLASLGRPTLELAQRLDRQGR